MTAKSAMLLLAVACTLLSCMRLQPVSAQGALCTGSDVLLEFVATRDTDTTSLPNNGWMYELDILPEVNSTSVIGSAVVRCFLAENDTRATVNVSVNARIRITVPTSASVPQGQTVYRSECA